MKNIEKYATIFVIGGLGYGLLEIIFRGFTHWTMALTGGLAYLLIYITNIKMKTRNLALRCLSGCLIITALEFIVGCIVNRKLHMNVWS